MHITISGIQKGCLPAWCTMSGMHTQVLEHLGVSENGVYSYNENLRETKTNHSILDFPHNF